MTPEEQDTLNAMREAETIIHAAVVLLKPPRYVGKVRDILADCCKGAAADLSNRIAEFEKKMGVRK